jgi:hypothetical protein
MALFGEESMNTVNKNLRNTAFMVMPFSDQIAEDAYKCSTRPVIESCGMKIVRADEIFSANPVFDDIIAAIEQSALVIVDISGRNPNCLYELGVSHTMKRSRTVMITHDDHEKAPFDIAHFRIIQYQNTITGKTEYENALRRTVTAVMSGLPEVYADEFEFLLTVLKGAGKEHEIWAVQAIALATRPLRAQENAHVEGTCPRHSHESAGMSNAGPMIEFIRPFCDTGYVVVVGDNLALSDKGRAFAEYVTAKGYNVYAMNEMVFVADYIPFEKRFRKGKIAPE